jgi:hypothetical protein
VNRIDAANALDRLGDAILGKLHFGEEIEHGRVLADPAALILRRCSRHKKQQPSRRRRLRLLAALRPERVTTQFAKRPRIVTKPQVQRVRLLQKYSQPGVMPICRGPVRVGEVLSLAHEVFDIAHDCALKEVDGEVGVSPDSIAFRGYAVLQAHPASPCPDPARDAAIGKISVKVTRMP